MDKLDLFLTAVFIVGTIIIMILIYFYNTRHELIVDDELDEFEVETKVGEKALYSSGNTFDWNLYESDLKYDYGKFVGYDLWKNEAAAKNRISDLREQYTRDNKLLKINMLETMMLVDRYGEDVILDANGVYRIRKINIENFLDELDYTIETMKQIAELKDELEFSIDNYEVDAKKIFYIMKNARSFGLYNFNNHSQVFLFAKKHKSTAIDAEIILEDSKGMSEMNLLIEEFIEYKEDDLVIQERKDDMFSAFKKIKQKTKIYHDEEGNRIIEYPNGQKIIKKNLWEIEAIDEDELPRSTPQHTKEKFSDIIKEDSVSSVMENANTEAKEKRDVKKQSPKIEKNKNKRDVKEFIVINNSFILNAKLYDTKNNKKSLVGFMGDIQSVDEFIEKLKVMSKKNIKTILILILSIDAAQLALDNDNTTNIIFELNNDTFISYEYIALVLLSLIENRNEFAVNNKAIANNGLLLYPISIVDEFIKLLAEDDIDFSKNKSEFVYLVSDKKQLISLNAIKLSEHSRKLLGMYNSPDKMSSISAKMISKDDFKKSEDKKYSVNFKTFCQIWQFSFNYPWHS